MTERAYGPRACGSCRLWRPILEDQRGPIGPCRLQVRTGDFPGTAPACERFLSRDAAVPAAPPPEPERRRRASPLRTVVLHRAGADGGPAGAAAGPGPPGHAAAVVPGAGVPGGTVHPALRPAPASLPPLPEELTDMTREEFADAIRQVLREEAAEVRLAPKWEGGTVVLKPGDPATQPREIPIDALLHKVVMIRDRLRVLEAKLNAHEKLSDAEKVDLQQYLTRCYGSLTSFNLLFREEKDRFVGDRA